MTVQTVEYGLTQTRLDLLLTSPFTPIGAQLTEDGQTAHLVSSAKVEIPNP
jgi:hypothetical protein